MWQHFRQVQPTPPPNNPNMLCSPQAGEPGPNLSLSYNWLQGPAAFEDETGQSTQGPLGILLQNMD